MNNILDIEDSDELYHESKKHHIVVIIIIGLLLFMNLFLGIISLLISVQEIFIADILLFLFFSTYSFIKVLAYYNILKYKKKGIFIYKYSQLIYVLLFLYSMVIVDMELNNFIDLFIIGIVLFILFLMAKFYAKCMTYILNIILKIANKKGIKSINLLN